MGRQESRGLALRTDRPCSTLRSGGRIYWDSFEGSNYTLDDVAYGLARTARFSGQTLGKRTYNGAQHAVLVGELLRSFGPMVQLLGYWHDDAEFLLGDLGTPIKRLIPEYKAFEVRFLTWLLGREHLPPLTQYPCVKMADDMAMVIEGQSFMHPESIWQRRFRFGAIKEIWGVERAAHEWKLAVLAARKELGSLSRTSALDRA